MRILLVKCFRPFESTPLDKMAWELLRKIQETGNQCELVRIPETDPDNLFRLMGTLEIENTDRLVSLEAPSHGIRHPVKILAELKPGDAAKLLDSRMLDQPGVARVLLPREGMKQSDPPSREREGIIRLYANIEELVSLIVGPTV